MTAGRGSAKSGRGRDRAAGTARRAPPSTVPLGEGERWARLEAMLARGEARGDERARGAGSPSAGAATAAAAGALAAETGARVDDAELAVLERLARYSQLVRGGSEPVGNVVFLHGITGSDLASTELATGDRDVVWVNVPRLALGRIEDLRLDATGAAEANSGLRVEAIRINASYYARAILALRARWNVEPFAYDWRRDIDAAADALAALVSSKFAGKPVHLVAHSMGGLVARAFIRRHRLLWDAMASEDLRAGGRLVMLGTPNYGSFSIPPVLTGGDDMIRLLELLDLPHNLPELLAITNTFVGSYLLLPAPSKMPVPMHALFQRDTWGAVPGVSQDHLTRAYRFHGDLESGETIDPRRMCYVAGCRRATISAMRVLAPGEFDYSLTYDGDGRVPHALGLLPGVPAWFVDEVHGDLARNESVLAAVDELLETGRTSELATSVLRRLDRAAPTMREYRTAADRRLMEELARIARKVHDAGGRPGALTPDEQQVGADALVRAALGASVASLPESLVSGAAVGARVPDVAPVPLEVGVRFADVSEVDAPAVVVGHYRGVPPANALGALDAKLGRWIARAIRRGMISGSLGETFYVPVRRGSGIAADSVVVAGMGESGRFDAGDLRLLMSNVAAGADALGWKSIASVLVGAGQGNLDLRTALGEFVEGIGTGLQQIREERRREPTLRRVEIVERSPARFGEIATALAQLAAENGRSTSAVRLALREPSAGDVRRANAASLEGASPGGIALAKAAQGKGSRGKAARAEATSPSRPGTSDRVTLGETRLAVECASAGVFRFSALSDAAVVPVREVPVNLRIAIDAGEALRRSRTRDEQEKFGRLLYTYLVPEDFHEYVDAQVPLRLIVDRASASFPWEMACFPPRSGEGLRWLGLDALALSRQFRTLLARAPGVSPPLNDRLRVLVVADPAPERELQLPGARSEGRRVVDVLERMNGRGNGDGRLEIEVVRRIGASECEPVEVLALLLSGDFDIVHFAGHGAYDPAKPDESGWVFGRDTVLTARDIFRARRVPRLVFANACFSGVIREGVALAPDEAAPALATIAQAFLERGVPNYVGTGWAVDDAQAALVAGTFYESLLARATLGAALASARRAAFDRQVESTWGAYQHYGNPGDTVVRPVAPGGRG